MPSFNGINFRVAGEQAIVVLTVEPDLPMVASSADEQLWVIVI